MFCGTTKNIIWNFFAHHTTTIINHLNTFSIRIFFLIRLMITFKQLFALISILLLISTCIPWRQLLNY